MQAIASGTEEPGCDFVRAVPFRAWLVKGQDVDSFPSLVERVEFLAKAEEVFLAVARPGDCRLEWLDRAPIEHFITQDSSMRERHPCTDPGRADGDLQRQSV